MQKRIFVGLDVHAESIAVARLDGDGPNAVTSEIATDPKIVARTFKRLSAEGEVIACYEAGGCGFELYRQIARLGVRCLVVAPSLIPRRPGERIKTDRRDAVKLARMLRAGELVEVFVPTEEQEAARDLVRARGDAREERTAARHRLGKFLLRHGRHFTDGCSWTRKHWSWIRAQCFEGPAQVAFEHYIEQVQHLDARIVALDEEIQKLAEGDVYRERVGRLSSLRGVSTLCAMVLLTELCDLRRFDHPRKLMAYLGLVPSEHSSGTRERRGGITKTGNAHVRRVLVEAAWAYKRKLAHGTRQRLAMAKQPPKVAAIAREATARLTKRFARLAGRGKRPQVAVTAVARELCGFVWALETLAA